MLLFLHSSDKIVGVQVKNLNFCSENVQNKNSQEKSKKMLTNEKNMLYYSQDQRKSKSNMDKNWPVEKSREKRGADCVGISDLIACFIQEALDETDGGVVELQRGDLAQRFHCVPSQINYVMSTRFSPEHGYIVESRRGGNGYIRITRVRTDRKTLLMQVINSIGDTLDFQSAKAITNNLADSGAIETDTAKILLAAMSETALREAPKEVRNRVRADIFKQVLIRAI